MENKNDGGAAFPVVREIQTYDNPGGITQENIGSFGITMRDYFAAKALQGAWANNGEESSVKYCESTAQSCYAMADAMLKARNA